MRGQNLGWGWGSVGLCSLGRSQRVTGYLVKPLPTLQLLRCWNSHSRNRPTCSLALFKVGAPKLLGWAPRGSLQGGPPLSSLTPSPSSPCSCPFPYPSPTRSQSTGRPLMGSTQVCLPGEAESRPPVHPAMCPPSGLMGQVWLSVTSLPCLWDKVQSLQQSTSGPAHSCSVFTHHGHLCVHTCAHTHTDSFLEYASSEALPFPHRVPDCLGSSFAAVTAHTSPWIHRACSLVHIM